MQLICVVLNHYDMWRDSMNYMDNVFNKYCNVTFADTDKPVVFRGGEDPLDIRVGGRLSMPVRNDSRSEFSAVIVPQVSSQALPAGSKVGIMQVYEDNRLLFSADLFTMIDIKTSNQINSLMNYSGEIKVNYDREIKQISCHVRSGVTQRCG